MPTESDKRDAARLAVSMQGFSEDATRAFEELAEAFATAGTILGEFYADGWSAPVPLTRWQRFSAWMRWFWLDQRWGS